MKTENQPTITCDPITARVTSFNLYGEELLNPAPPAGEVLLNGAPFAMRAVPWGEMAARPLATASDDVLGA